MLIVTDKQYVYVFFFLDYFISKCAGESGLTHTKNASHHLFRPKCSNIEARFMLVKQHGRIFSLQPPSYFDEK